MDDQTVGCALKPLRKSTVKRFEHENTLYSPSSGPQGLHGESACTSVLIARYTAMNHIISITVEVKHERTVTLSLE